MRRFAFCLALSLSLGCGGGGSETTSDTTSTTTTDDANSSVSFTLGSQSTDDSTTSAPDKLNCEKLATSLEEALKQAWPKEITHGGLSLAVRRNDCPPWAGSVGNAEPGTPLTPNHVMGAGGMSKSLMTAAFLTLVKPNNFEVFDPASKALPELDDKTITVRDLLNNHKALAEYTRETALLDQVKKEPTKAVTTQEILASVYKKPIESASKLEQFLLGQSNAIAIEQITSQLSKKSSAEFIEQSILTPMKSKDMFVWGSATEPTNIAPGWRVKDGVATRRDQLVPITYQGAAAGLRATPSALAQWLESLLTPTSPVPPTELALMMRRTSFNSTAAEQHGYGLKIWTLKPGVDGFGNDGLSPGYATLVMNVPTQKVTVAIMTNNESQIEPLLKAFGDALSLALQPWIPDNGMPRFSLQSAAPFIP